jgi:fibro-slime domain-containing protein
MSQNVSRSWLGVLGLVAVLGLARCGSPPELSSKGNTIDGNDASSAGSSSANGGSGQDLNTMPDSGLSNDASCDGANCTTIGEAGAGSTSSDLCGDGVVGKSEECDDGNATPGDGCSGLCMIEPGYVCAVAGMPCTVSDTEVCGDGKLGMHEACDDGNNQNGDGCSSTCTVEAGYTCDPASGVCTPIQAPAVCGNGLVEFGEDCDDGNMVANDGCTACKTDQGYVCPNAGQPCVPAEYCGDGILQVTLGEDCDDGNNKPGDGCDALCHTEAGYLCSVPAADAGATVTGETCTKIWVCGNGKVDPHEACDDGGVSGGCSADCKQVLAGFTCSKDPTTGAGKCVAAPKSVCGNAVLEAGEACDDGNKINNDGCTACKIDPGFSCVTPGMLCTQNERCGDGVVDIDRGEQCDDKNTTDGDGCSGTCQFEPNFTCPTAGQPCKSTIVCGDGTIAGNEQCDDGTKTGLGGCSTTCQLVPGYLCPVAGQKCVPAACGDGIKVGNEQCDDGNTVSNDGCSSTCKIEPAYACVATGATNPSTTTPASACHLTKCGDGKVDPTHPGIGTPEGSEECDLGDLIPYDGCSPTCKIEPKCANGTCTAVCGDGFLFSTEACDDGNTFSGDGCSSTCTVEPGFYCTSTVVAAPKTLNIPILYRDFLYWCDSTQTGNTCLNAFGHPDFQRYAGPSPSLGLVASTLAADGFPVFANTVGQPGTDPDGVTAGYTAATELTSAQMYYWWWHEQDCRTLPCVANPYDKLVYLDQTGNPTVLPLAQQADGSYQYSSTSFFPIDNLGWVSGTPATSIQTTNGHNFSFDSELRYQFTYNAATTPAPKLSFFGDDDVWVFINGKLAVDLGGLHSQAAGSVTLNTAIAGTLGLTSGGMYDIVVFQAERHTTGSNYQLTLDGFEHDISSCVTKCGDGIVAGNEVCDDGKNDGSYGGCMPGCLSRGPYCGDNKLQSPPEACDNGVNSVTGYGNNTPQCAPNCQIAPYCGDGVTSNGEQCDDGASNGAGYGFCLVGCKLGPRCGDGNLDTQEQCDDGVNNGTPGSLCQLDCTLKCGNGKVDPGEACDLGAALNTGAYNGCNADCTKGPYCGDGFQDPGEDCDDGKNDGTYGTCNPGCKQANYCGDGIVTNPPETCDNGAANSITAYGKSLCTNRCLPAPYCGDHAVEAAYGEKCDDGKNDGTPGSCAPDCSAYIPLTTCGNGTLDKNEQCDDGASNGLATDKCDAHCHFRCGNGIKDSGEACDDGVNSGAYGTCNSNCTLAPYCGDGILNGTEQCDQGAKNVALATAYGKTVCTSVCTKAPYCGDGRVQSAFEDCDGTVGCSATCTSSIPH